MRYLRWMVVLLLLSLPACVFPPWDERPWADDDVTDDDDATDDDDDTGDDDSVESCWTGTLLPIPDGTFKMGSPYGEGGHEDDELQHRVTLSQDFEIAETEVTQDQFEACMGYNPARWDEGDRPVERVSWHEAAAFTNEVSEGAGLAKCYVCVTDDEVLSCEPAGNPYDCAGFRLPTEAEWEYAARGGLAEESFPNGGSLGASGHDCDGFLWVGGVQLDWEAWYCGNADDETHPVGDKDANGYGLHDMSGNVFEWCHDGYETYPGTVTDPVGENTFQRVFRGGAWSSYPTDVRVANREFNNPQLSDDVLGFRIARTSP